MKKTLITIAFMTLVLATASLAVVPNVAPYANGIAYGYASYGSYPVNPAISGQYNSYASTPVRIGGFYGSGSTFLIGLKPGFYDGPVWNYRNRYTVSASNYPRVGGYFGGGYYYNLRPGTTIFSGVGTAYSGSRLNYLYHGPV